MNYSKFNISGDKIAYSTEIMKLTRGRSTMNTRLQEDTLSNMTCKVLRVLYQMRKNYKQESSWQITKK